MKEHNFTSSDIGEYCVFGRDGNVWGWGTIIYVYDTNIVIYDNRGYPQPWFTTDGCFIKLLERPDEIDKYIK